MSKEKTKRELVCRIVTCLNYTTSTHDRKFSVAVTVDKEGTVLDKVEELGNVSFSCALCGTPAKWVEARA